MQYHYIGLDDSSVEETSQNAQSISEETVANTDSHNTEAADDAAMIAEGDEHRIQISGAPSMMCAENPDSFRLPEKPLNFMTDSNFEAMSPYGVCTFSRE